ncbi:MAG: 30S ribosomal protein S30 [Flavobacteriales bacterium]|nr:30S ribosomal protein S30 [Flavobacteriales bacterium]|tara:strand:+ start:5897 stop:6184 length:288 start_codon:yes stop_codon:yes gene_type:complete
MKVEIQSIHFSPDGKLVDFVNKKLEKISLIDDGLIKTDVFLKIDKPESPENKIAEIRVHSTKGEYFAKKQCNTFEESIDLSVQALRKQVLRQKGR